jgi:hypothetical protein
VDLIRPAPSPLEAATRLNYGMISADDPLQLFGESAMNRETALQAIENSLALGSNTPCTWHEDRDVYIQEQSDQLRASIIDPIKVQVADSEFKSQVTSEIQGRELYAIAQSVKNWLIYTPDSSEFALANGDSVEKLTFVGFYSSDALAEWLG